MRALEQELFQVGVVVGIHGLRGDLKVRPLSDGSTVLLTAGEVWLARPGGNRERYVPVRCIQHKKNLLLRLKGAEGLDRAELLVGCEVLTPLADLPDADNDEDYWFDLEGLTVVDRRRGEIGRLNDLFATAAHDIYVVTGPFGEVLIPAVKKFVLEIDQQKKIMLVDLPDGLVAEVDTL
jgi:16S rRNA processing protein RimM